MTHTDEELTDLMADLEDVGLGEDPHEKLQRLHTRWARTHLMSGTRSPIEEARIIDWQILGLPRDGIFGPKTSQMRLFWTVAHFFLYLRESGHDAKIVAAGSSVNTTAYYIKLGEAWFGGKSYSGTVSSETFEPKVLESGPSDFSSFTITRTTDDLPSDLQHWLEIRGLLGRPETIELP